MKRSFKKTTVAALVLGSAVIAHGQSVLAGEVTVAGSTAMAHSLILPYQAAIEKRVGQNLSVSAVRSLRGLHSLVRGDVDIAMISAPLSEMAARLEAANPGALDGQALVAFPMRGSRSAFIVHPSNPVQSLSAEAVHGVLTGEIKNWKALGGPDRPIEIVIQHSGAGLRAVVERDLAAMGGELAPASEALTLNQVVWMVSVSPYAIGVATVATVDQSVVPLQSELVFDQPMYLVTRDGTGEATQNVIEAAVNLFGSDTRATRLAAKSTH